MLKYDKYLKNIQRNYLEHLDRLVLGEEEKLLIREIPKDFHKFLSNLKIFLQSVRSSIRVEKNN